jgi:hypothetical protein
MKALSLLMILLTSTCLIGQEKNKIPFTVTPSAIKPPANSPATTPPGSSLVRTLTETDSILEPKQTKSLCANNCICEECLVRASCELEKIENKLPYLQMLISRPKGSEKLAPAAGPQAIAAARMIARLKNVAKESKQLDLLLEKAKDKSKSEKEKKGSKVKDPNQKKSSSSRGQRLTTSSDAKEDEEFDALTDPGQDNLKWRLRQASADLV